VAGDSLPSVGETVHGIVEWTRRHQLMRTHSALHVLCGVIWNEWRVPVTGGNMEPLSARMDFEFDPLPEGFGPRVEQLVNDELAADRPIEVSFLPRSTGVMDEDLIRTKVSMIPESVPVRVPAARSCSKKVAEKIGLARLAKVRRTNASALSAPPAAVLAKSE
jgi:misacylated tRNA(Ala) deacylase